MWVVELHSLQRFGAQPFGKLPVAGVLVTQAS